MLISNPEIRPITSDFIKSEPNQDHDIIEVNMNFNEIKQEDVSLIYWAWAKETSDKNKMTCMQADTNSQTVSKEDTQWTQRWK